MSFLTIISELTKKMLPPALHLQTENEHSFDKVGTNGRRSNQQLRKGTEILFSTIGKVTVGKVPIRTWNSFFPVSYISTQSLNRKEFKIISISGPWVGDRKGYASQSCIIRPFLEKIKLAAPPSMKINKILIHLF